MHAKLHDNASRPFSFAKSSPAPTAATSNGMPTNMRQGLNGVASPDDGLVCIYG
jgi:hypothetical protein